MKKTSIGDLVSPRLRCREAYLMCHFTFVIYAPEMATLHVDAKEWGWTLVGYASSLPSEPRDDDAWLEAAVGFRTWPGKTLRNAEDNAW